MLHPRRLPAGFNLPAGLMLVVVRRRRQRRRAIGPQPPTDGRNDTTVHIRLLVRMFQPTLVSHNWWRGGN